MLTRAKDRWWKMKWSPPNSKPWSHPPLPSGENYYRRLGLRDLLLNLPLMVAARLLLSRAGWGRSHRANGHPGEGRFFMVSSHTSISTSPVSKILDLSGPVVGEGIQRITPTTQTGPPADELVASWPKAYSWLAVGLSRFGAPIVQHGKP